MSPPLTKPRRKGHIGFTEALALLLSGTACKELIERGDAAGKTVAPSLITQQLAGRCFGDTSLLECKDMKLKKGIYQ